MRPKRQTTLAPKAFGAEIVCLMDPDSVSIESPSVVRQLVRRSPAVRDVGESAWTKEDNIL